MAPMSQFVTQYTPKLASASKQFRSMAEALPGWEVRLSRTKEIPYFFNTETKESSWVAPDILSDEEINQLPGAAYLSTNRAVGHHERSGAVEPSVKDRADHEPSGAGDPQKVRARHLLVKHRGSRRPSSWKERTITRTQEEAIAMLHEYQAELDGTEDTFARLAEAHSDCSSYKEGGDLGWFSRGKMQKPFEDATFALEVGQVSDVISTESGVHLILRTK